MADFTKEDLGGMIVITVPTETDPKATLAALRTELDQIIPNYAGNAVIVNFKGFSHFGPELVRMAAQLGRTLSKRKQRFYFAGLAPAATKYVQSNGLDNLVLLTETAVDARNKENALLKRVSIDVSFVNPFIEGALETLKIQCSFEAKASAPTIRKKEDVGLTVDIIALIGLTSKAFNGTVALCFPGPVFLKIMSGMLGEDCKELNQEIEDGAGELLNIIFGQAKIKLNEKGHQIEKAIPSVIRGNSLSMKHMSDNFIFVLPFTCDAGQFEIQIATDRQSM